jgi:uncharacterized protein (TIGR02996 family)
MSLEEAFLRDIIGNPDDDTPRLVYADWLEERGDVRGEFIRVQCRLARMDEEDAEYAPLFFREQELLERHRDHLVGDLAPVFDYPMAPTNPDSIYSFRRGFIERVCLPMTMFVEHADTLFARAPIRSLALGRGDWPIPSFDQSLESIHRYMEDTRRLSDADRQALVAVANCRQLTRIRSLNMHTVILRGEDMRVLVSSPFLIGLTELCLTGTVSGDEEMAILAGSPILQRLTSLLLGTDLGLAGLRSVVESDHLGPLTSLYLWGNGNIGPAGAAILAAAPRLAGLRSLNLNATDLGDEGATALAASPHLRKLTELYLKGNQIGPAGMRALAASPVLTHVSHLDLWNNPIGPDGARALADSLFLSSLTELELPGGAIGPEGATALANSFVCQRLKSLRLDLNEIGTQGAVAMAQSVHLHQLVDLDLSANDLGDEGVLALVSSAFAPRLRSLELVNNRIGPAAVEALARSPALASLKFLGLASNGIGERGVRALLDSPYLRHLEWLDLQGCDLTEEMLAALTDRFGDQVLIVERRDPSDEQD